MSTNPYYNPSGTPGSFSPGASSVMRGEFAAVAAGFAAVATALTGLFGSPGPIGNVTPGTGVFSTLSVLNAVTFFKTLTLSGSLTGTDASFSGPVTLAGTLAVTGAATISGALILGSGGPTITTGAGAPASTQPKGSTYSRTDGGVGSTLYVSQGAGVWNAVAGA